MNPPLAFADALTQLSLLTSQEANFTFTADELTRALQEAWNNTYVVDVVWDSSLVYSDTQWQYTIPSTVTTVRELFYQKTTTDNPEPLSPELYDIINGNIQFRPVATRWLITGMTIYIKGVTKLTTDDELDTQNLINYVIYLAAEALISGLIFKSMFVFLRNDTTMADIVRALGVIEGKVLRYKQALLREFESA